MKPSLHIEALFLFASVHGGGGGSIGQDHRQVHKLTRKIFITITLRKLQVVLAGNRIRSRENQKGVQESLSLYFLFYGEAGLCMEAVQDLAPKANVRYVRHDIVTSGSPL